MPLGTDFLVVVVVEMIMISMACITDQNIDLIYAFRLCLCAQVGQLSFHCSYCNTNKYK